MSIFWFCQYAGLLYEAGENRSGVFNVVVKHCYSVWREEPLSVLPYTSLLLDACLYGPVHKKDIRVTKEAAGCVEAWGEGCTVNFLLNSDHDDDNKVRVIGLCMISRLEGSAAKCVFSKLLQRDEILSKSRERHFANSGIHRQKHRVWQAVLLLEPMLDLRDASECEQILQPVFFALMYDNQPSVRYQIEWVATRLLFRYPQHCPALWGTIKQVHETQPISLNTHNFTRSCKGITLLEWSLSLKI